MRLALATVLAMMVTVLSPAQALSPVMTFDMQLALIPDKREKVLYTLKQFISNEKELECALNIAYKESRYNVDSHNKSSGARGVWQLLWGKPEWSLLKQTQEAHEYVLHRYETWCNAYRHHRERNWY
jgi:hypothetical protein